MLALGLVAVSALFLILATYSDLKTTEIPDKFSVGLFAVMVCFSALYSFYAKDYSILLSSVLVGLLYFGVGSGLFYLGQWGGGDVKILAGIGASLGLLSSVGYSWPNSRILPYYLVYFINMGLTAIPYVVLYTLIIGFRNRVLFEKFVTSVSSRIFILMMVVSLLPSLAALYFKMPSLALSYTILPVFTAVSAYLKVTEEVLFKRKVSPLELKVGDVLAEDVFSGAVKVACRSSMEGLTTAEVEELHKLGSDGVIPGEVTVKLGVKFMPILLLAFLGTVFIGNPIELLLSYIL